MGSQCCSGICSQNLCAKCNAGGQLCSSHANCCSGRCNQGVCEGAMCKQFGCYPQCNATEFCKYDTLTCVVSKSCTPACKTDGTQYCDGSQGVCIAIASCTPACKSSVEYCNNGGVCVTFPTCQPACASNQYCDLTAVTCKPIPVCVPACDLARNQFCVQ